MINFFHRLREINAEIHKARSRNGLIQFILYILKKQFFRFCIVGVVGVSFNYSLFFVSYRFLRFHYILSSAIGFICAIFLAYYLNSAFTFNYNYEGRKKILILIKYFGVNVFSLMFGLVFLRFLVEILKITPYIANVLNIGLTTFTNYFGSKFIVFRERTNA